MGLVLGFVKLDSETKISNLRSHDAHFTHFFDFKEPPFDKPFSNFLIEEWMVNDVADQWGLNDEDVVRAEAALSEAAFERIRGNRDNYDFSELRPVYRRILERLRKVLTGPYSLVGYYSA